MMAYWSGDISKTVLQQDHACFETGVGMASQVWMYAPAYARGIKALEPVPRLTSSQFFITFKTQ